MKIHQYIKWRFFLLLMFTSTLAFAVVPAWKIVPAESSLTFTAIQNGAPVTGKFKTFYGDIHFDPIHPSESNVMIIVDVGSVNDSYNKLTETLKSSDWFNVALFPKAIFKSTQFTKTGDKNYECKGTLTLRDKTLPVTLTLTLEEYSATRARMKGSTIIKRTAFGVGQGEWADISSIKDDVEIHFVVNAVKK